MAINPRIPTDNFPPTWPVPSNALPVGLNLPTGKSAYQSYLDTTTDDPVLSEAEWSALNGTGGGVGYVISPTEPPDPVDGLPWYDTTTGIKSIYLLSALAWIAES